MRPVEPPDFYSLLGEIELIRRKGITELRSLKLPAFEQSCWASGAVDTNQQPEAPQIEALLRRGIECLGTGRAGESAVLLFGLEAHQRGDEPHKLRADAAERWGVSLERFRRDPQDRICRMIAEAVLRLVAEHQTRMAYLDLERRLPTTSRLAIQWLERFEAYYRIWTPITGVAGELCAYRQTMIDPDRLYDDPSDHEDSGREGSGQDAQAAGYITSALWHFTDLLVQLQQFKVRHSGLWLLSDARAEQAAADAIYRIWWHSPNNDRDDSFLRGLHHQAEGELHQFHLLLESDRIARATLIEWQEWASRCDCQWEITAEVEHEHFPTHRHHPGISPRCQLHAMVSAANDFTTLIDDDWRRIADWYRLGEHPQAIVNDRKLFEEHVRPNTE